MILAIAALLIQPQMVPQLAISAGRATNLQPAIPTISTADLNLISNSDAILTASVAADASSEPATISDADALPDAPVPAPAAVTPVVTMAFIKPGKSMTVSIGELRAENRRNQFIWRSLAIASSGAATFDAWTTRRAIGAGAVELNPMLKPFAGNSSLYAAMQVGPALMDYVGKKMMYSRFSVVRHMWWVPQSAGFVSSLFCGAHNLSFH
jgi:hypothetical protein